MRIRYFNRKMFPDRKTGEFGKRIRGKYGRDYDQRRTGKRRADNTPVLNVGILRTLVRNAQFTSIK